MSSALQRARPQMIGPLTCAGDGLHRLEVARRGDGEAGLDDVHAEVVQGAGDSSFSARFMLAPGDLLAVAQRRVEDDQAVVGHGREAPVQQKKP